ncbi:MAG: hotdog fold thioesterase [Cardiobacteriaceae bacterium]|nr:hotdog fold thioesterase [Cardiobacteriaceae bacterium]
MSQSLAARVAAKMIADDRYSAHLGIEIVAAEADYSACKMTIGEQHLNGHGTCHGGAMFSLADTVFAHICNAGNRITVGHICTIAYWAPAYPGDTLYAVARVNGEYGRSGSYRITLHRESESGETIAEFQGFSRALPGQTHFPDE